MVSYKKGRMKNLSFCSLIVFLLLIPLFTKSQLTYHGVILNNTSKQIIPFASIGLIKENKGINADEHGKFELVSFNPQKADTLIVSCIGFQTLKIPVDIFLNQNLPIELTPFERILKEVVVTNKKYLQEATLNPFSNCGTHFFTTSGYMLQIAQHLTAPVSNAQLKEIKICRFSIPIIATSKAIFRIRLYDLDTLTNAPGNNLTEEIIEVKTKSKFIQLNLTSYNIIIPTKHFFVAIEWLKIPYNEEKVKTKMPNGKIVESITYHPDIGYTNTPSSPKDIWMLDYKNKWRGVGIFNSTNNLSISATVTY